MMMRPSILALAALGGCVADTVVEPPTNIALKGKCPEFGCGENTPVAGPFEVPEFEKHGAKNRFGVTFSHFEMETPLGTQKYDIDVDKDRLIALHPGTGIVALDHQGLTGGKLIFEHPEWPEYKLDAGKFAITINHVTQAGQAFWVGPASFVETYELLYEGAGVTVRTPMCKSPPADKYDGEGNHWQTRFESIFFTGDRYDPSDMTVTTFSPGVSPKVITDWINVACAGSVPAKLHLNRHTDASKYTGYTTTVGQRQAMLKLYVGDFCGKGTPFTVAGTPIHWTNGKQQNSPAGNDNSWEAVWNSNGAICMDLHRLSSSTDPTLLEYAEGVRKECPDLPRCGLQTWPFLDQDSQYVVTQSKAKY